MIDTEREARDYFNHNPKDKKVHFCLVMDDDLLEIQDTVNYDIDILETVENEEAEAPEDDRVIPNDYSIHGRELFEYFIARFNYTEEQALKVMKERNQDISFYEGVK